MLLDREERGDLRMALGIDATVEPGPAGLSVLGLDVARTGEVALAAGLALTHLSDETDGLESVFLALTADEAASTAAPAEGSAA